jgi:hypothetical protein
VRSNVTAITDSTLKAFDVVVNVTTDHYRTEVDGEFMLLIHGIKSRLTEMGSTDVVLFDKIVQGGTERSRTIVKVELRVESGSTSISKSDLRFGTEGDPK